MTTVLKDITSYAVNLAGENVDSNPVKHRLLVEDCIIVIKISIEQAGATDGIYRMTVPYTKLSNVLNVAKDCYILKSAD